MLCDKCKQHEATVHKQVIINGVAHSEHLCAACAAKERGAGDPFASFFQNDLFGSGFFDQPFASFFAPFFQSVAQPVQQIGTESGISPCPQCGTSWEDFQHNGFLGCSECYDHFKDVLPPLMRQLHSEQTAATTAHNAETERTVPMSAKEHLQAELERAIASENFEEAAHLRDAIKALEDAEKGNSPQA